MRTEKIRRLISAVVAGLWVGIKVLAGVRIDDPEIGVKI